MVLKADCDRCGAQVEPVDVDEVTGKDREGELPVVYVPPIVMEETGEHEVDVYAMDIDQVIESEAENDKHLCMACRREYGILINEFMGDGAEVWELEEVKEDKAAP